MPVHRFRGSSIAPNHFSASLPAIYKPLEIRWQPFRAHKIVIPNRGWSPGLYAQSGFQPVCAHS